MVEKLGSFGKGKREENGGKGGGEVEICPFSLATVFGVF